MKIIGSNPAQLQLEFALWNRRAVMLAIKQLFGIEMPIRTVGEYLRRWGFTPQRPVKRALEQDPARLKAWLQDEYPKIVTRAKAEEAEIYWGDETAIRQDSHGVRSYPKWSELLPDDKQLYYSRIINFTSHSTLSNEAVAQPTPAEKATVKLLLDHLKNSHGFWQQQGV
ncbi:MAG: winged helix-turn-helix domain-containing protein [Proteobacteria bacterium]|nr:winged helix-turn-helix domain-containing protein [Pseudomonadota bacterium]